MYIEEFLLERNQSLYENTVSYNLTESGLHPYSLRESLTESEQSEVLDLSLGYGQTNGDPVLRDAVAALYPGLNRDNVLLTNGSAEANYIALWSLLNPGDEIVLMLPNYMLVWGVARSFGVTVKPFYLSEDRDWGIDLAEIESQMTDKTKMIVICNPNNPTGSVLSDEEMRSIANIADKYGAWVMSDEIYRGSELDGVEGKSFMEFYDRSIILSGLSKAMAHPGLRIGWIAASKDVIDECWHRHDYTSISTGIVSQYVGERILQPEARERILTRGRTLLNTNLDFLAQWVNARSDRFSLVPPKAGGMAFVSYKLPINSTELVDGLRKEKSVFVVPGDWYGMDNYLRFGIGCESDCLHTGLELFDDYIRQIS
jgi:aspartate/methionine/tyrosine aminotransferase